MMIRMFFTRDKSFYSSLVKLAIPIALQNAITFAVNFADNLMIGSLGDSAISGVYVGNQLQTLLQKAADKKAMELLDFMGLADVANVKAGSLPYGVQRRLEIVRALASNPSIILLDEPTISLKSTVNLSIPPSPVLPAAAARHSAACRRLKPQPIS